MIDRGEKFNENKVKKIIYNIASGLKVIHGANHTKTKMVHRDLQPSSIYKCQGNYLIGKFTFTTKITDLKNQ